MSSFTWPLFMERLSYLSSALYLSLHLKIKELSVLGNNNKIISTSLSYPFGFLNIYTIMWNIPIYLWNIFVNTQSTLTWFSMNSMVLISTICHLVLWLSLFLFLKIKEASETFENDKIIFLLISSSPFI